MSAYILCRNLSSLDRNLTNNFLFCIPHLSADSHICLWKCKANSLTGLMNLVATSWTFNFSLCCGVCSSLAQSQWISIRNWEDSYRRLGWGGIRVLTMILAIWVEMHVCSEFFLNFENSLVINYVCFVSTRDFKIPVLCIPLYKITVNGLFCRHEDKMSGQCQSYLADGAWVE